MNEIAERVATQMQSAFDNGVVDKLIETQLNKMIVSILEDSFRSYGDFSKAIKEKLNATHNYNAEGYLYKLYCSKTKIIGLVNLDESEFSYRD